jgi:VWFA-related protein
MKVGFGNRMRIGTLASSMAPLLAVAWLIVPGVSSAAPQGGTLRVEVDLVTIEVIAQDKKGTPMLGLKKEDFKIYEDGKQQQIVSFDAVADNADEPMPTSLKDIDESNRRGKVVLILFDDSNITASQIHTSREAAEKYVKEHMRPWEFFGVASYGLSLKIAQNLTHDADKVVAAIREPAMSHAETRFGQGGLRDDQNRGGIAGPPGQMNRQDPMGRNQALDQQAKFRSTVLLRTLGQLSGSMARVKGRKSVLLFSEDFALASDAQIELRNTIQSAQKANVAFYSIDARGLNSMGGANQGSLTPTNAPIRSAFRQNNGSWLGTFAKRLLPGGEFLRPASSKRECIQ